MSETLLIWLFGGAASWMLLLTIGGLRLHILITEVRAILRMTSKRAAEILHSPDDHLGIDSLLDKYIEREHELTWPEWGQLLDACDAIAKDSVNSKQERFLAAFLCEVCKHKRMNRSNPKMP